MKALFYYLFGIITMLMVSLMLFNKYHVEYLDDYYINLLHTQYFDIYKIINKVLAVITIIYISAFAFRLGKGIEEKTKEPLLFNKDE